MTELGSNDRAIHRYEVPVDDHWHDLTLTGPILHIATRRIDVVEVWAAADVELPGQIRRVRIFGTGQVLPDGHALDHLGTAIVPSGELVWHLLEDTCC